MPSHQSVPADLLADLAGALSRLHARWYVFGAQAVVLWGRPRLTADIDVTARMDPEDPEGLALLEEALGQSDLRPILERELALRRDQPG